MSKSYRYLLHEPGKSEVLVQLRERLLKMMLFSSLAVGTVLFGLALIPVLQKKLYITILIYSLLYLWTILITFVQRLPYRVRAIGWLGILYVFGSINLINSGLNVDAGLFFITFIAMAILLMDIPGGLVALFLSSVTIFIMGFQNVLGHYVLPMGLPQSNPLLWIIGGIIFLLLGILLIYSLASVVSGLEENLAKTTRLAEELEKTNQSLRISEARYRTLMETSPGLVALLDLDGNILMANKVGLTLFGYENLEEVAGKNLMAFMGPQDQPRIAEAFQRTLQGGLPNDFECLALRKDGTLFLAEFNGTMVKDETGKPQAVICIGRDITARKEAEQVLREAKDTLAERVVETTVQLKQTTDRFEQLIRHGPTVIYSYQAYGDHTITYISDNVVELLGYKPSELIKEINYWERVHPEDKARIFALSEQVRGTERVVSDYRFLNKDGTYRWLRDERVLMKDPQGNPLEYVGSWSDITDRKKTEETLKNSETKYRTLYESMMDAYVSVGMDGWINEFNQAYVNMLGYSPDELRKLTYIDLTPRIWHAFENEIVEKQVLPKGYSEIYEKEYIRKDGTVFPVELRTILIRDESGNPSGMWAIVRDISGRKLIEWTLRESEGRYRDLLDNSMQGVIVFQDMRIVYVNQAVTESLGYSQAELETLKPEELIKRVHPDDRWMFLEGLRKRLDGFPTSERYSLRVVHKNGEIRRVEARTVQIVLQGKPALMTTAIDVTDIRLAEAELKENARILQTIINASSALVFLTDTNGVLIASNDQFSKKMGIHPDAVAGTSLYDILPEEVAMARKIPFEQAITSRKRIIYLDSREGIWYENSINPIQDESGKVVSVAVFARDISEQRRVTEALRTSEEQYRTLAEASHDMIFTITRDDRISYVNSFGAKLVGSKPQQMVGQPRERFFPPATNQYLEEYIQRVIKSGQAISSESANFFAAGTVWLNTWLVPLKDASGEVTSVLGVARDITRRKQSEEALQQARDQLEERVAERTKELSASQEKLRFLTAQTITAQEEERRVISRELHDEAGQALITLKYGLAAIQSELPESDAIPRQRLSDSMKIIDQTMVHIRALAHRLRPPVLEIGGIHLSLQDYCRELTGRTNIPIYYQGMDIPGLPDEIGISLFRFVQEAITNIMKHAQATEVKIRLQLRKAEISLSVSDNGRGIADSGQTEGLGLQGIKERLILLGGKLEVHSKKGLGAKLVARIPWTETGNR